MFITRKTGPMNGLQLILQVEKFELLRNLIDGSGFRLVIHEPETFPFPQDEGYTISSGHETTIGMKMVRVVRAEEPYGMCDSGDIFYKTYGFRYTMQACLQICRNRKVVEICNCRPSEHMDIKFMDKFNTTPVCSSNIQVTSNGTVNNKTVKGEYSNAKQCEEFIYFRIDEHYIDCECASPCRQTLYQSTISGRMWPKDSFLEKELLNTRCEQFNYSYCDMYRSGKNSAYFKDNFLKLVVYYEDMNYEEISEEPSYDGFRFLSDLGGAMGLFLGASLLSFLELVQLLVELFNYHRHKCRKGKIEVNKDPSTCIIVKPTKETTVMKNIFTVAREKNITLKRVGSGLFFEPDNGMKKGMRDPVQCQGFVYLQIAEKYINCGCTSPCSQTLYQSTISGRVWPKESFLEEHLLKELCTKPSHTYCKKYLEEKNSAFFKDNFLKLVIYYEDTHYEEISEEPSYDGFRFLSDLGGAMGLFLGASVLSFLELVQLFVELSNYHRHKCLQRKNKVNENPNINVNPTKETNVSKNIFTVAKDESEKV